MSLLSTYYAGQKGGKAVRPRPVVPVRVAPTQVPQVVDLQDVTGDRAAVRGEGSALEVLLERASSRVEALRRLLGEAQQIERGLMEKTSRLKVCLERTCATSAELGERVKGAAGLAARLGALEPVIDRIEGGNADAAIERGVNDALSAQRMAFEARIAAMQEEFDKRLAEIELRAKAREKHLATGALQSLAKEETRVAGEMDRVVAQIDRHAAQVQARVGVMLDEADQRVRQLKREAAKVDPEGRHVDALEHAAHHLLGSLAKARNADEALARSVARARQERALLEGARGDAA